MNPYAPPQQKAPSQTDAEGSSVWGILDRMGRGIVLFFFAWILLFFISKLFFDGPPEPGPAPQGGKQMLPQRPTTVKEQLEYNRARERAVEAQTR